MALRPRFPTALRGARSLPDPVKCFGIAGLSGSGKTTLLERLLPRLTAHGLSVACVKHSHHAVIAVGRAGHAEYRDSMDGMLVRRVAADADAPGKDSGRLARAGALVVVLAAPDGQGTRAEADGMGPDRADRTLARAIACVPAQVDLVLVEGFKQARLPKLEVHRPALGKPMLWRTIPGVVAIASDTPTQIERPASIPVFDLDDLSGIGALVWERAVAWTATS